jgi:tetratricopeptide (TPR) repeat protein
LEEAEILAQELGDSLSLLEINIQQRHLTKSLRRKAYPDELKSLIRKKNDHLKSLHLELGYLDTADELFVDILQHFQLNSSEGRNALRTRMAQLVQSPPDTDSPKAYWRYLLCMAMYHQLLGEFEEVFHYYSRVVDWWDERPTNKKEDFYLYIIDVSNLLHAYSVREEYERIPAVLDRLEREDPDTLHARSLLFQKSAVYRLMYFINMGVSEGVDCFVDEMELGLDKYEIKAGTRNALIVNVSILLFVQGRFKACVNWAQKLIRDKSGARADIRTGAWILQLMAVLGIGDVDLTESVLRATARYLAKTGIDKQNSFEYAMLNFAKKVAQASPSEEKKILVEWRTYITDLRAGGSGKVSMGLDELALYWINSRLEKSPIFLQIRQHRVKKRL